MSASENPRHIWDQVCKTDPKYTKPVNFGAHKFTSIDAMYQIERATEVFGPVGSDWGYSAAFSELVLTTEHVLAYADVTIWYRTETLCTYGPVRGVNQLIYLNKQGQKMTDEDAFKKALTDAMTKALSHLGFSADVFLGKFDDNRYVDQRIREQEAQDQKTQEPPADVMALVTQYLPAMQDILNDADRLRFEELLTKVRAHQPDPWPFLWAKLTQTHKSLIRQWHTETSHG